MKLATSKPRDRDRFRFQCEPWPRPCPANAAGGPDRLTITSREAPGDFDIGWTGVFHNFEPPQLRLDLCVDGCGGAGASPECALASAQAEMRAVPTPLLAGNVPMCAVARPAVRPGGRADLATGVVSIDLRIDLDWSFTHPDEVCPRCRQGQCTSGPKLGEPCTVDAVRYVDDGLGNVTYALSADCPPHPNAESTFDLTLTTGTTDVLAGDAPCGESALGIPPMPDNCSASCDATCTGNACVQLIPDPITAEAACVASRGGLSQLCCGENTTRPCFPLADGGLFRQGVAAPPVPPLPDATLPKRGSGMLASVFCQPRIGLAVLDRTAGLQGPAALLLPVDFEWTRND